MRVEEGRECRGEQARSGGGGEKKSGERNRLGCVREGEVSRCKERHKRETGQTKVVVGVPRAFDALDVLLVEQGVDRLLDVGNTRLEARLELLNRLVDQLLVLEGLARFHDAVRKRMVSWCKRANRGKRNGWRGREDEPDNGGLQQHLAVLVDVLHDVLALLLLLRLDGNVEDDPDLLALEAEVELVVAVLELEDALLDECCELRLELLGVDTRTGLDVGVGEGVGRVELEEDAGLVGRGDEEVLLSGVERAESAERKEVQYGTRDRRRERQTRYGSAATAK